MKYDIKVAGNAIGGRQGWAYICNSMKVEVLVVDADAPHEYEDYKTYSKVRAIKTLKDGKDLPVTTTLACENGKWSLSGHGCFISNSFGYDDVTELISNANSPVVREGDVVAIAFKSDTLKAATLLLYKVGRMDIHCTTVARLEPLTDEEMQGVAKEAERWCSR